VCFINKVCKVMIIWDKIELQLGMSWGNNLGTWGTIWEHDGNTLRTRKKKILLPLLLAPKNKTVPLLNFGLEFAWEFLSRRMNHGGEYSPSNNHKRPKICSKWRKEDFQFPETIMSVPFGPHFLSWRNFTPKKDVQKFKNAKNKKMKWFLWHYSIAR